MPRGINAGPDIPNEVKHPISAEAMRVLADHFSNPAVYEHGPLQGQDPDTIRAFVGSYVNYFAGVRIGLIRWDTRLGPGPTMAGAR
jgi:hypothetical protein